MTLRVNNTAAFNLEMNLNINYDLEYIEITVSFWNKAKNTIQTKTFPAADFAAALRCWEQWERMFF